MSKSAANVPCSFTTKAGRPCRAWAVRGSDPPACSSHLRSSLGKNTWGLARASDLGFTGRESAAGPGFYSRTLTDEELADLVIYAAELTLDDEIACTRIAVRRTLEFLSQRDGSLDEADYLRAAGLVFQGARTIARLLRDQQALLGGSDNRLQAIFDAALDALSEEWGIEL